MLYRAYLRFEEEGRFDEIMEQIFDEGQKVVSLSSDLAIVGLELISVGLQTAT
jgi:hypothetical protein